MIKYALICDRGHEFDGWFRDGAAFDEQAEAGQVPCPVCGSSDVSKALMAPGIPAKSSKADTPATYAGGGDPNAAELVRQLKELRKQVEASSEYVGDRFPEEARRIHYEETEKRGIFGEASAEDARELVEEGIEVCPLPKLPEDHN